MKEWNRNKVQFYENSGDKITSKDYTKRIFLERELFMYNLFEKNKLIKTPKIYNSNKLNLQTHFISTDDKDVLKAIKEWVDVHSYYLKNPIENNLLIYHDFKDVSVYISKNIDMVGELDTTINYKLFNKEINKNLVTILHGDFQEKNMITSNGNNYYFDFELSGLGHPARDIASMIISLPNKKDEIIDTYRKYISFDYPLINEDIDMWVIARAAQLCVLVGKRDEQSERKKFFKERLSDIIKNF